MSKAPTRNERLVAYGRPYLWWYVVGIAFLLGTNVAGFAIPAQIGGAVQMMRDAADSNVGTIRDQLVIAGITIIVLAIIAGACRIGSRIAIFNAGRFV